MAAREKVLRLLREISHASKCCPAHSHAFSGNGNMKSNISSTLSKSHEYAFEMACSNIRYGPGVTQEVGMDLKNMKVKNVAVLTDKFLRNLPPLTVVLKSLEEQGIKYELFSYCRVEPTDKSILSAIEFSKKGNFDAYVALGGGSVIDTCKAANLYASNPEAEFLDFVNKPIGKGRNAENALKPMIAIPTTTGTGSETTATAIFDYTPMKAKTGISIRAIRPTLGLVDPLHAMYQPGRVVAYSGFDVLCHALESYTNIKYFERSPKPKNPSERPVYQGSNPISDIWSLQALRIMKKYFKRSVFHNDDMEARSQMHLASTMAGIGFGNAGVHLCHGMSYAISGLVKTYYAKDYSREHPIIPHGLSVVITAPAVFEFTAPSNPERHLEVANILGYDTTNAKKDDAGPILADVLRKYMSDMKIDNGLSGLGYTKEDIPALVKGTLPQHRILSLVPLPFAADDLSDLFEKSMTVF